MNIRYRVELDEAEKAQLRSLVNGGKHAARKAKRAQILLAAHDGVSDDDIARTVSAAGRRPAAPSGALSKATWPWP